MPIDEQMRLKTIEELVAECLTTDEAANDLGLTASALRTAIAKYGVKVMKHGNALMFTRDKMGELTDLLDRVKDGGCPKCGWKPPAKAPESAPAPAATEGTPAGDDAADANAGGVE